MMRMMVLLPAVAVLLSCGLFDGEEVEHLATPPKPVYLGPTSLEERIFASAVIARVRLDSTTPAVEYGPTVRGMEYIPTLEFSFSVLEYLKGSGAKTIVAVWDGDPVFDTQQEAEAALPAIAAARDAQWDDREAILFLQGSVSYLPSTQQTGRYYLQGDLYNGSLLEDYHSIASPHNRLWLPAAAAAGDASQPGDQQRFLTAVPPATGTAPTITLGEIKTRIAAVAAKLAASDGSEDYLECVQRTYQYEGRNRHRISTGRDGFFSSIPDLELGSGLAASSVVYETTAYDGLPNQLAEIWLDGGDADLFSAEVRDPAPHDFSGDGENDSIRYAQRVVSARPLPKGVYRFHHNNRGVYFVRCDGYTIRYEWTVTVKAPAGTLHEAFFDPVTDGRAVAADSANGVLKPAAFTNANGTLAAIQRIAWEAGAVELRVTPHTGISDHVVDFIEMDGTVSLSLMVDDATVDAANSTLSWAVASQPWEDGDTLMLRIRDSRNCSHGTPACNRAPVFDPDPQVHAFEVGEDARRRAAVGTVAATDPDVGDTVTHAITAGNTGNVFAIDASTGAITVAAALDHETTEEYTLTVEASDEQGLTSTTTATITVTDVAEEPPPAPTGLTVTLTRGVFTINWTAVDGARHYDMSYGSDAADAKTVTWTGSQFGKAVVTIYTPEGGPACETTYRFRVRAYGDGVTYTEMAGNPSDVVSVTTGACGR